VYEYSDNRWRHEPTSSRLTLPRYITLERFLPVPHFLSPFNCQVWRPNSAS